MRRHPLAWASTVAVLLSIPAAARPRPQVYAGPHPVDPHFARGLCQIEGPHFHAYAPHKKLLYLRAGGEWHFIGDPVQFEPELESRYAFVGHHPLFWVDADVGKHFCYISGPHFHLDAPDPELGFELKGDAYWYVGPRPAWYRPPRRTPIDNYYAHVELVHPEIHVTPPAGFIGIHAGPGGAVMAAGVTAPTISAGLHVELPSVGLVIGGRPAPRRRVVYVRDHDHRHGPPDHAPAWGYRRKHKKGRHGK